MHPK
jgi:hypothetical protein